MLELPRFVITTDSAVLDVPICCFLLKVKDAADSSMEVAGPVRELVTWMKRPTEGTPLAFRMKSM
jgi:hypothetical protein